MTEAKLEEFTRNVKDIFDIQDQIRLIAQQAREKRKPLKEKADELEGNVREFMIKEDVSVCNYQDERLELKKVIRFGSLTKKSLHAALVQYLQDEEEASRCFDSVMEHIGSQEIEVLKRMKNRKRKAESEDASQLPAKASKSEQETAPDLSDEDSD